MIALSTLLNLLKRNTNSICIIHRKSVHAVSILTNNSSKCFYSTLNNLKSDNDQSSTLLELIDKYEDKIIYSSVIESKKLKLGYKRNKVVENKYFIKIKQKEYAKSSIEPLSLSLKHLNITKSKEINNDERNISGDVQESVMQFPFEKSDKYNESTNNKYKKLEAQEDGIKNEIALRKAEYEKRQNWMTDYENYDDSISEEENENNWRLNYGTPDPTSKISKIPCGGCGALLHCKVCIKLKISLLLLQ